MPVDNELLLYSLAYTFKTIVGTDICAATDEFLRSNQSTFEELCMDDKMYYTKYAMQLAQHLVDYVGAISLFEIWIEDESMDILHDFRLIHKKKITYICMSHNRIGTRDVIPEKLMKICKFKKNTTINKAYREVYDEITKSGYKKIKSKKKYSNLPYKLKRNILYKPLCQLVLTTLAKKRKCTANLFHHLFEESDRIVLKLYKNRYVIYDFSIKINEPTSYRMEQVDDNSISVAFNNGAIFMLCLQTNGTEIRQHLSLKFHNDFVNINDIYAIIIDTIKTD